MAIITISRQLGSLGTFAAEEFADSLGYTLINKETLEQALSVYGIAEAKVEQFDEKKPSIWAAFSTDRDRYLNYLKTVIFEHAARGNVAILGRGAQVLLADLPGTLHVRVVAPRKTRLDRVAERFETDLAQAEHVIRHSDHDRSGFYRFFFNVNWNDPTLYDLVINSKHIDAETTADMIRRALKSFDVEKNEAAAREMLADLTLGQKVQIKVLYEDGIPVQFLEARASEGKITLNGAVTSMKNVDRAVESAKSVEGVTDVTSEISFISYYGMM
jgi:cytidylate kinase